MKTFCSATRVFLGASVTLALLLTLVPESESHAIGDLILALPTDHLMASQRLDLFPTIRTLVRVMRMINRPAAMDRVKDGLKKIVHKEQKPLGPLKGAHKRIRLIRRLLHIFGKNQHREDLIKALANLQ